MMNKLLLIFCILAIFGQSMYIILLLHLRRIWMKAPKYNRVHFDTLSDIKVSVLIALRNEEANIISCLTALKNQDIATNKFEIICVDDHSTDKSVELINNFLNENPGFPLQLLQIKEETKNGSPKKQALKAAVTKSSGKLLLFTDADCVVHQSWISTMAEFYTKHNAKMLCGPVVLQNSTASTLLSSYEELDFISLQLCSAASLLDKKPLMSNGANLGIDKNAYLNVIDKTLGKNLASGDDMFLMLALDKDFPGSIHYVNSEKAIVKTGFQKSFLQLLMQRKRWASKGFKYANSSIFAVSQLVLFIHSALLVSAVISFIIPSLFPLFLGLFLSKTIVDYAFLLKAKLWLRKRLKLHQFVLFEFLNTLFVLLIIVVSLRKGFIWKGRKLN